jgi:hypothetical protein
MDRQPFSNRRPLDPRRCNVAIDANAFDQLGDEVERLLALRAAGKVTLVAPGRVREEALHPNTPPAVREIVSDQIFSLRVGLTGDERQQLARITAILQGNAAPGKHTYDAHHVFEAAKYGCAYFITHDRRINQKKRQDLEAVLSPSIWIVTLAAFLQIYDDYEAGRLI